MIRILIFVCALALPWLADARDPRGNLDPKVYGSTRAQYDDWLYVPIVGNTGKVAAAQIMTPARAPASGCSVPAQDPKDNSPVLECYPHLVAWCEGGKATVLLMAPESGGRFISGKNGPVHWSLDKYIKGRWVNLYQVGDLSRMGQGPESSGGPDPEKMMDAKSIAIEQEFDNAEKSLYSYSLKGFAGAYKKCLRATRDSSYMDDILEAWEE